MTKEKEYTPTISDLIPAVMALSSQVVFFNERLARLEKEHSDDLRDRIAMAALTGIIASYESADGVSINTRLVSEDAYLFADSMLEARKK